MKAWMVALCAVRFDLELGQTMDECCPHGVLSAEEQMDVAFSSFPDSMSSNHNRASLHDTLFMFKIKRRGVPPVANSPAVPHYSNRSPAFIPTSPASHHGTPRQRGDQDVWQTQGDELPSTSDYSSSAPRQRIQNHTWSPSKTNSSSSSRHRAGRDPQWRHTPDRSSTPGSGSGRGPGSGQGGVEYLYGYVFNRQRHDERLKRGGEQKSVVLLTHTPYTSVFRPLVQIAGSRYFDKGFRALEEIEAYVSNWPLPAHGSTMDLNLGSTTLKASLPPVHTLPPNRCMPLDGFTAAMAPALNNSRSIPQGIFHESDIFGMYKGVIMHLWLLWELVLVGEPILIIAPTVSQCSEAVTALVGLIAPLPCALDFRPYFTIHDPDFGYLNSLAQGDKVPPVLLGVTNLFFLKALKHLPHVVSVGKPPPTSSLAFTPSRPAPSSGSLRPNSQVAARPSLAQSALQMSQLNMSPLRRLSGAIMSRVARAKGDGPLSLMTEHREAVWSNYEPCTKPDTAILNRLVDSGGSTSASTLEGSSSATLSVSVVNNNMLRRHFLELTTNFLAPFGPYLRSTAPAPNQSPFTDPPTLPSFDAHEFLRQLADRGPGKYLLKRLSFSNWLDLYRKFLEGPNFMPWFQRRRQVAEAEQHRVWRRAREEADVALFLPHMTEVERVEAFSTVEKHICVAMEELSQHSGASFLPGSSPLDSSPIIQKLRSDLRAVYNWLPRDAQQMLLFNPRHAAILKGLNGSQRVPGRPLLSTGRAAGQSGSPSPIKSRKESYSSMSGQLAGDDSSAEGSGADEDTVGVKERSQGYRRASELIMGSQSAALPGSGSGLWSGGRDTLSPARGPMHLLRKAHSNPTSPFAASLSRYFDWSPSPAATTSRRFSASANDGARRNLDQFLGVGVEGGEGDFGPEEKGDASIVQADSAEMNANLFELLF